MWLLFYICIIHVTFILYYIYGLPVCQPDNFVICYIIWNIYQYIYA